MSLTRDAVLKAQDVKTEKVEIPEWGGEIYIRCMTGEERSRYDNLAYSLRGEKVEVNRMNFRERLLVFTLCDESGNKIFEEEDISLLAKKSGAILDRLYVVSARVNGMRKEDMEQLGKN